MSPRAAWRLEQLGYAPVFDYVPGKMDWLAFDLPYEGTAILAGRAVERDLPTCRLDEPLEALRDRLEEDPGVTVAVNDACVVMGIVPADVLEADPQRRVEDAMTFGITTVRPSEDLEALTRRMGDARVEAILVTRSDGTLVGLLRRARAERLLPQSSTVTNPEESHR